MIFMVKLIGRMCLFKVKKRSKSKPKQKRKVARKPKGRNFVGFTIGK